MTFPYDMLDRGKTVVHRSTVSVSGTRELQAGTEDPEEAFRTERRGWIVPAVLCLLLTAGSFYYYHQKVAWESRNELKVIRADASLRKANLTALQRQARVQQQQLATSPPEDSTMAQREE